MSEVKRFDHEVFGTLTVVTVDGVPMFIAKQVCDILGHKNPTTAVKSHVEDEDKQTFTPKTKLDLGLKIPNRGLIVITESGVYDLILGSRKGGSKKFKRWVTKEVLPSIRNNEAYISDQENMDETELLAKAVLSAQNIIDEKNRKLEEKDTLIQSKNHPVSLSKLFGRNNKIAQACNLWLEDKGYLGRYYVNNIKKGWELTEAGKELGYGSQVGAGIVFWTSDIRKELPSTKALLEFAERMDLVNFNKVG